MTALPFVCGHMKKFAVKFYKSVTWQKCRDAYAKSRGHLCERCLERGIYRPGEIVHHRTYITPENINDPSVTLSWDNLELLCRECHAREHGAAPKRYVIDPWGRVTPSPLYGDAAEPP